MSLSLVLPCFNEEGNIERVTRSCLAWFDLRHLDAEVIVTNDGSKDRSGEILASLSREDARVRVVTHPENRGYGAALRSGCDAATKEFVAFMDGDGQFHASDLALLLPHLAEVSFVTGYRVHRADPLRRKLNAALYGLLLRFYVGLHVRDVNCAFKVFRRSLWPRIRPDATGALFNAEVFVQLREHGIRWKEIPVPHYPRISGAQTGAKISVILRMFRELHYLRRKVRS